MPRSASIMSWTVCVVLAGCAAGSSGTDGRTDGGRDDGTGGEVDGVLPDGEEAADGADAEDGAPCSTLVCGGACCAPGEFCRDDVCCTTERVCGATCCGADQTCEFDRCWRDCGDRPPCGSAEVCCAADEICHFGECRVPGAECLDSRTCPSGEYCDPGLGRCMPLGPASSTCIYTPPAGVFDPAEQWSWAGSDVMMTPAVADLTDDNGDGAVDESDVPDVAFVSFSGGNYYNGGVLHVLSGDDGREHFAVGSLNLYPGAGLAVGEVDADGTPEIVACAAGGLRIISNTGADEGTVPGTCATSMSHPAIADLEGDGTAEIVVDNAIVSGGALRCHGPDGVDPFATITAVSDVDGDGRLDVVSGNWAMDASCGRIWYQPLVTDGFPAIADMDADGLPEVVTIRSSLWVLSGARGAVEAGPIALPGGGWGGAPTIADFDGDDAPEVGTAGINNYVVFDLDCVAGADRARCPTGTTDQVLWTAPTSDSSSEVTGSSVFDFEGDGLAEVVYSDEFTLRVYRGTDGTVLFETPNSTGTLSEYPVIADVDADEHAEIVVVANSYAWGSNSGVRVFHDRLDNWVRTRRVWNEHTYHVTNVEEDGRLPRPERANWLEPGLNNFRQNVQTENLLAAPDLVPSDVAASRERCSERQIVLRARIVNAGAASAPPGVAVSFYEGRVDGVHALVAVVRTTRRLMPGESEVLEASYAIPAGRETELFSFYVVVDWDDATGGGIVHECLEDNNTSPPFQGLCLNVGG